ncbi:MAG: PAS domain-containing protein [Planctomycetales bacterium]|nr:PAS domain-containing protein [Planctomycetales bacterium]
MDVKDTAASNDFSGRRDFFVVGIGASAGGLEALERFFPNVTSGSGIAYVLIQHLSPEHRSMMTELLGRHTALPITEATDNLEVHPDHIYLIPPGKEMIIAEHKLRLSDRPKDENLLLPIDHFLRSLAHDCGSRSIGIILSGTGSDGSRGIREIHEAGGLVLAQSEDSARFNGMPRTAQETGIVDAVLPPEEMPAQLERFVQHPLSRSGSASPGEILPSTEEGINTIFRLLRTKHGIDFNHYKAGTITRRIERRLALRQSLDLEEYAERLVTDESELDQLYADLLIGVTRFFRDAQAFAYLDHHVIGPMVRRTDPGDELRIWVAATGTGEEAYSLAMLFREHLDKLPHAATVKIFATDVHEASLERASRGIYPIESIGDISVERLRRFFTQQTSGYHVTNELRKMIVFAQHNVVRDAPFTALDMVTCRNMLIYLRSRAQKKAISLFHFGLKVGGTLWLGPSETVGELSNEFELVNGQWKIFQKSRDVRVATSTRFASYSPTVYLPTDNSAYGNSRGIAPQLLETYDRLLDEHMPPSLLITNKRELSHTFAGASRYLQHRDGRPTNDVLDMVLPEIRLPLATSIQRVIKERGPVVFTGIRCNALKEEMTLTVKPFFNRTSNHSDLLVTFQSREASEPSPDVVPVDVANLSVEQIQALEAELQYTKESLQATIEELETTNEELQATNEELIASNEELQSTNEELHSVNEELYTVNSEYQRKITELTEVTDDMDNLLNSTNVDTVFLDRELRIRKFTPGVAQTFNLIPQDVGRRIDNFTHNIHEVSVLEALEQVLRTQNALEYEVRTGQDKWFLLRILPYLAKKSIEGVVLTLIDITSLKQAEVRLTELSEIVEQSTDAILRLDLDGTIRTWNRGAEQLLGYESQETVGRHISLLLADSKNTTVQGLLAQAAQGESVQNHRIRWRTKTGTNLDISLHISPIRDTQETVGISAIARDMTDISRAESEIREAVRKRDQFLAMLSHELRNPLAAILNATDLLKEQQLDEATTQEARAVVEKQLHHVARLLDDLLDVARFTNDKLVLHRDIVDLTELVMDVVECVQHQLEENSQQLQLEIPDHPLYVDGDVGRLQQAQVNLLINASKYSPRGTTIHYSLRRVAAEATICVRDEGVGISSEMLDEIFEPFTQEEQSLDRAQGGMGLGLPLVRMIAEAHEGTVGVSSLREQPGSEFWIRLPLTDRLPQSARQVQPTLTDPKRLLLIEDNEGIRKMLARSLELKGFVVGTAADGRQGLKAFASFAPDVAIVDIGLPDINGFELVRQVRRDGPHKPLMVAVTGYGRDEDRERAVEAGFDLHLVKPIDPTELVAAIAAKLTATDLIENK